MGAFLGSDELRALVSAAKAGDFAALGRFLSWIERQGAQALELSDLRQAPRTALRLGITGPPGAGKSTLTNHLLKSFREQKKRIGVIAVDPSSPFSRGAILGDRIRYVDHFADPSIFIRSVGTRGSLGGLSASAYLMLRAFDLCGFDLVLIETVGVGQTELEVVAVADLVTVVLVPESGDAIQAMKAGLLEIADVFVVNKADRPGADGLVRELEALSHGALPGMDLKEVKVFKTVAVEGEGVAELSRHLLSAAQSPAARERREGLARLQSEAAALLRARAENEIENAVRDIHSADDLWKLIKTWSPR